MNDLSKGLLVVGFFGVFIAAALLDAPILNTAVFIAVIIGIVLAVVIARGPFDKAFFERHFLNKEADAQCSADWQIPKQIRKSVWQRDGGCCAQCGSRKRIDYSYIIPLSKGGSTTEGNIQLLCEQCNKKKHAKIGGCKPL